MKEKGFTLIELLAVIVILSVITLITVPMITNVIEESKKKALLSSVQGVLDATDYFTMSHDAGVYEFLFDREHQGSTQNGESLEYKGKIDGEGKLYVDKEGNTSICISNDNYYAYKNYNSEIMIGERSTDNCNIEYDALTNKYVAFLESKGLESNVYSRDEVDNLVDSLDTKITKNTNEISNIKNNIEELQNNLNNYALQSELNSNINNLSSIITANQSSINDLNNKLNWHVIDGGSNIVQDEGLKTANEISVYMSYGSIVRTAPADAFETMYGVGIDVSLYANNLHYSNFSYIKLDRSQGKLISSFQYGEIYTEANSFIKVYYR